MRCQLPGTCGQMVLSNTATAVLVAPVAVRLASYRFADYTRLGLPLQLLVLATALIVIPLGGDIPSWFIPPATRDSRRRR